MSPAGNPQPLLAVTTDEADTSARMERLAATLTRLFDEKLEAQREELAKDIRKVLFQAVDGKIAAALAQGRSIATESFLQDLLVRVERLERGARSKRTPSGITQAVSGVFRAVAAAGGRR